MEICDAIRVPQRSNGLHKQLPRLVLELQQVIGPRPVEYPPQRRPVGPEEEELLPEAL
jgi:hypothetical protein